MPGDLPAIMTMIKRLHEVTGQVLPLHPIYAQNFIQNLIIQSDGLVAVLDVGGPVGILIASVGRASVSPAPVAIEHGWYVEPMARGHGRALLAHYEAWAKAKGCVAARMSSRYWNDKVGMNLMREGYEAAEVAWVKVF